MCKHDKEHAAVEQNDVAEHLGKVAVRLEQGQGRVDKEGDELDKLHRGQVSGIYDIIIYKVQTYRKKRFIL